MTSSSIGACVPISQYPENPSPLVLEAKKAIATTAANANAHNISRARSFIVAYLKNADIFFVPNRNDANMRDDLQIALALSAGALYVYVGLQKADAPEWAFDVLVIIGALIVAGVLYKLLSGKSRGGDSKRPRKTRVPSVEWGPRGRGAAGFSPAGSSMETTLVPGKTQKLSPPAAAAAKEPSPFEPDVLSEWTTTLAPGQTSWDSSTMTPRTDEIAGFAFGGR